MKRIINGKWYDTDTATLVANGADLSEADLSGLTLARLTCDGLT